MATSKAAKQQAAAKAEKSNPAEAFVEFDDLDPDISNRPLSGQDLVKFRARHGLQTVDAIYALGLQNSATYNKLSALRPPEKLPFALEMLIRLYDRHPGHAPWGEVTATQAFERLYGDVQKQFKGTEHQEDARLALFRRATALFGRSVYTAYRWFQSDGKGKQVISKIFQKLASLENPRKVLEDIARQMYRVRGYEFDRLCPLPTLENPPLPRRRGPLPKHLREQQRDAVSALTTLEKQPLAREPSDTVVKTQSKRAPAKKAAAKKGAAKKASRRTAAAA